MSATEPIEPGRVPVVAYVRFVEGILDYAMFFLDTEGKVASWNKGAERLMGYAPAEIVGRPLETFYPAADIAAHKPQFELRVAAARGRFEDEGWRLRKDGTMFWANVVVTAIHHPDGSLQGFAKVTRDMTARKHAEEALRASEERFRLLTRDVRDYAIFMLDARGHIISWNEGARLLKGYEASEIIGEHFSRFYTKPDIDRGHPEHELEIAKREGRYEEEGWRVRKDGTTFWANVTITALRDATGRHVGFAKVTRDLTARKRAEEELKARAASYAELNRELDAFSHTVAHDLRSPIRAVEHLSSVLLREEVGRLSEEGKQTLRALHQTADSMAQLVQDLLAFSTSAARPPVRSELDVTRIAREVAAQVVAAVPERRIEVRVADGLRASADPALVRVALSNLLANAVKFTRPRAIARIEVGAQPATGDTVFFVRDNGVGVDPHAAERLFQPFTRLHSASEFEGTGIGLATVARIVQRHGGRIWAEAKPDQGASFYFTLPEVAA